MLPYLCYSSILIYSLWFYLYSNLRHALASLNFILSLLMHPLTLLFFCPIDSVNAGTLLKMYARSYSIHVLQTCYFFLTDLVVFLNFVFIVYNTISFIFTHCAHGVLLSVSDIISLSFIILPWHCILVLCIASFPPHTSSLTFCFNIISTFRLCSCLSL